MPSRTCRNRLLTLLSIALGLIAFNRPASSADLCKAIVLKDVPAIENPASMLARGDYDTAITQYRKDKFYGTTSFCSHGGYCYPTHVKVRGQTIEALRLLNCKVGKPISEDKNEIIYSVEVDRSKNTTEDLYREDLDNRFLEMGLCSACAGNVAQFYIKQPHSRCANLARQALEGNPVAAAELKNDPDYCHWRW
jgi:hypothetical protein